MPALAAQLKDPVPALATEIGSILHTGSSALCCKSVLRGHLVQWPNGVCFSKDNRPEDNQVCS